VQPIAEAEHPTAPLSDCEPAFAMGLSCKASALPLALFTEVPGRGILGTSHQTSGGGIMLVVERDAPLQLKREEGAAE
jgi:hypothetical protein